MGESTQEKCEEIVNFWAAKQIVLTDIDELQRRRNRAVRTLKSQIKSLEKQLEQAKATLLFVESEWDYE